eukprot:CAMPEP_0197073412 /NCGR_PEP_ID=MMETSP1384-20130603/210593_1 /TAXON_ID=29189 /ORGANISM="Ammonia sp." /LENGTH=479 /DNA_ID=CAMNT_0042512249 /DNA_START=52 /DNA_END=1491 /DNA_ORIENTATION=+
MHERKSSKSSIVSSEHENTRNVLVILLGWQGANPRQLSKYNAIYDRYEDYIAKRNKLNNKDAEQSDKVHIIIKQYTAPICDVGCNLFGLKSFCIPILRAIQSHRNSFGASSHVIVHSFSTAGTLILCTMNDIIANCDQYADFKHNQHVLYYDGIIYDSPHLAPLSISAGLRAAWTMLDLKVLSQCVCVHVSGGRADDDADTQLCALGYVCCKLWYYLLYALAFVLFLVLAPIAVIVFAVWNCVTCNVGYVCCHDKKLMAAQNAAILCAPTLVLGSDADRINPVKKSVQFVDEKIAYVCCKLWYYLLYALAFVLFLVLAPIAVIVYLVWQCVTCNMGTVCCHDQKLMAAQNAAILCAPTLVLGSDADRINPVKKSVQFVDEKIAAIQRCQKVYRQKGTNIASVYDVDVGEATEDTVLLAVGLQHQGTKYYDVRDLDGEYIKAANRYFAFDDSEHVQHYRKYPKEYQREITRFMDLCLNIK